MISPNPARSRLSAAFRATVFGAATLGLAVVAGCGGDEPAPVAEQAPPPVRVAQAPPAPKVMTVDALMASLGIDDRIFMDEGNAPSSTADRTAVLEFFDSFIRGQDGQVRPMLAERDREFLDVMIQLGSFEQIDAQVESVELVSGTAPDSRAAIMALYVRDGIDEYQLWYYDEQDGEYRFEAARTPPGIVDLLSGSPDEWVNDWHLILDREMELASQPDIELRVDAYVGEEDEDDNAESSSGSGVSPSSNPGGYPTRHRPSGRRRPPGVPSPGG